MNFIKHSVFLIFINITFIFASNLDTLLKQGREYSYKFEFEKAESIYKNLIVEYPQSPFAPHLLSKNYLWFFLGSKDSLYKIQFEHFNQIAQQRAEVLYYQNEADPIINNLMGEINLQKSVIHATEGNSMDAFWTTKSALGYFEDAVDADKKYYDPHLGIGVIKYALSFVPGFLGWAISISGLDGDKEEGLKLIKLAYVNGKDVKSEAGYHLAKIYTEYNAEFDSAKIYLTELISKYPDNILFLYQYALLLIDTKNLNLANDVLSRIIILNDKKFGQTTAFTFLLKGELAFKQNDFKSAIQNYEEFLVKNHSIDYTGLAHFKIGLSLSMIGEGLLAKKYFILARNGNLDIPEDLSAKNSSYGYSKKKFSQIDRKTLLIKNNFSSGRYTKVLAGIDSLQNFDLKIEDQCKLLLIKSKTHLELMQVLQARKTIEKIDINNSGFSQSELADYYLNLSKIYFYLGDMEIAESYLELSFKNCEDNNNKLMRYLVNLNSKLKLKQWK